ncbi:hypothetical protein BKA65DRAFT_562148 [Rhexocercosporidium sp. MPI-PUGE-AT-0058]|nr:hypothetical protein BKA65DRAFT_562148 [Rhexocercosporidium sp. MPI-PUGE-AT-0058]
MTALLKAARAFPSLPMRTLASASQSLPSLASNTTPSRATNAQSDLSASHSLIPEGTFKENPTRSQSKESNKSRKVHFVQDAGTTSPKGQSKSEKPARRSSSGVRKRSQRGRGDKDACTTSPKEQLKSEKLPRRSSSEWQRNGAEVRRESAPKGEVPEGTLAPSEGATAERSLSEKQDHSQEGGSGTIIMPSHYPPIVQACLTSIRFTATIAGCDTWP